ncbi:hypothetical protein NL676_039700 [Syzygium grande]|nr:hypothetical protein NL676_039700 [Syzygium grande]
MSDMDNKNAKLHLQQFDPGSSLWSHYASITSPCNSLDSVLTKEYILREANKLMKQVAPAKSWTRMQHCPCFKYVHTSQPSASMCFNLKIKYVILTIGACQLVFKWSNWLNHILIIEQFSHWYGSENIGWWWNWRSSLGVIESLVMEWWSAAGGRGGGGHDDGKWLGVRQ